jgi:hypothetical protein
VHVGDSQLAAVGEFIVGSGFAHALASHDWQAFASHYNGPAYAKNRYDEKLQSEYQKYSSGIAPSLNLRAAQLYLTFLGYHPGVVDGLDGVLTRSAVADFQTREGLAVTGEVDSTSLDRLLARLAAAA